MGETEQSGRWERGKGKKAREAICRRSGARKPETRFSALRSQSMGPTEET